MSLTLDIISLVGYNGEMESTPDNPLANRLRKAIEESGLSMRQVSIKTGIRYKSVHAFVVGYGDLTLASASKIAALVRLELKPAKSERGK